LYGTINTMHEALEKYVRAADYLSAIQIYLQNNYLLEEKLSPDDIKPRLLGHWGTCPGINFVYAHCNRAIIGHDLNMMFILGPGHGFPAIQANLFLEGTLSKYYPDIPRNEDGIAYMAKQFSWPYGFPSHSSPTAPGVILEGGELGYALSTAYGAILDNPDLIATALIGDGEAETGPTATAWHLNKLVDPASNGAVLPILHLNGYKISGPTFFARMSDEELVQLFSGYGYTPVIVDSEKEENIHSQMIRVMDECITSIQTTQKLARENLLESHPKWPMIILRTPKGWNSIKELDGKKIEDNHYSHQVIAEKAKTDQEHLEALETWLRSYNFGDLFAGQKFIAEIESLKPSMKRSMGNNSHTMGGSPHYISLKLPAVGEYSTPDTCEINRDCAERSSMEAIGDYLRDVFSLNAGNRNFRLLSPDETYSNKLQAVFEVTKRAFVWPSKPWDKDMSWSGRVLEMLSEHSLQGLMQGYVLTGRHAMFVSYEAFVQIVGSMADQYAKFLSIAREVSWRGDIPSLNYILTSSGWRQEHNGFSHQNPGFIDGMLQRQDCFVNIYFPADANTALVVTKRCLESKKEMNVIVAGKRPIPLWRTPEEAAQDISEGISIWEFASDENPDFVMCSVGDYLTKETLAAVNLLRTEIPEMKIRFLNISSLSTLGVGHNACRVLPHDLDRYFTESKPVLVNFHGYPQTMKQILFNYDYNASRFDIRGYEEEGSTTTPFDMMVRNNVDRYSLVMKGIAVAEVARIINPVQKRELTDKYKQKLIDHRDYIVEFGKDPDEIENWIWERH